MFGRDWSAELQGIRLGLGFSARGAGFVGPQDMLFGGSLGGQMLRVSGCSWAVGKRGLRGHLLKRGTLSGFGISG